MSNNTPNRGNGLADTPEEEVLLIHLALIGLGALVGSAGLLWLKGTTWLIAHHVLLPARSNPLLDVPGTEGAGLDLPRIAVGVAVIVVVLAFAASEARKAFARGREDR